MSSTSTSPNMPLPPFDELVRLAREDPLALEVLRHQHADALIKAASPSAQPQLRALQGHIDRCISTSKNPLHTCVVLNRLLMRQLDTLRLVLVRPNEFIAKQAEVLPFKRAMTSTNSIATSTDKSNRLSCSQTPPSTNDRDDFPPR